MAVTGHPDCQLDRATIRFGAGETTRLAKPRPGNIDTVSGSVHRRLRSAGGVARTSPKPDAARGSSRVPNQAGGRDPKPVAGFLRVPLVGVGVGLAAGRRRCGTGAELTVE